MVFGFLCYGYSLLYSTFPLLILLSISSCPVLHLVFIADQLSRIFNPLIISSAHTPISRNIMTTDS